MHQNFPSRDLSQTMQWVGGTGKHVVKLDLKVDADSWWGTLIDCFHRHANHDAVARDTIEDEKVCNRRFFTCECFQNVLAQHSANHSTDWGKFVRSGCCQPPGPGLACRIYKAVQ
jgi:hypothetical protein